MPGHRRRRVGAQISRREFLRTGAGAMGAAALLAACRRPGQSIVNRSSGPGRGAYWPAGSPYPLARSDAPVTWRLWRDPIDSNLPVEKNATLQIFNWQDYLWKKVIQEFCAKYDCDYQITTFNSETEGLEKLSTGQFKVDVYFPSPDLLGKLITARLVQPLNHDYISHLVSDVWDSFQNPFYDQGWRYTVPYTLYTTGIGYRRDRISDSEIRMLDNPYEIFWDPKYKGEVAIYDSYREAIAMALLKNGITDVNTGNMTYLDKAQSDLIAMIDAVNVRTGTNISYVRLPKGDFTLTQAWSGDVVAAWFYTPQQTMTGWKTIGYWYPADRKGAIGNDNIAIPTSAEHPVLAHKFLDWMMTERNALMNFSWVGYQPPQNAADPATLTTTKSYYGEPYVFPWLSEAVVRKSDFDTGYFELELTPQVDAEWHSVWQAFLAGT